MISLVVALYIYWRVIHLQQAYSGSFMESSQLVLDLGLTSYWRISKRHEALFNPSQCFRP